MKILIADDNRVERFILLKVLEQCGHEVIQAETGREAIQLFFEHRPALVFLDVLMPDVDGYEVAAAISGNDRSHWVPIIFLTSLTEASDLAKCIECGGDDFVSKPINRIIIKAKVDAFSRISKLYETIEVQKNEIEFHNEHLIKEQEAAKRIFNNIAHRGCLDSDNINYHLSPMSIFNGDLLLAAETPMGGTRLMLADFTGHGLPAAMGALPTSEIFYSMTRKGFAISDVMTEMNTRLHEVLPRGIFCCVVIADIDAVYEQISLWNAGLPQAFIINQNDGEIKSIQSSHLPLGVQSPEKFSVEPQVLAFGEKHKLLAVTDGIIESTNRNDEMFGEERILDYIKKDLELSRLSQPGPSQRNMCDGLVDKVVAFTNNAAQGDDLSLLEVSFPHHQKMDDNLLEGRQMTALTGTLDSSLSLSLRGKSLARFDPIPLLLQTILECRELTPHRSRIFTILSELYNNAVEHGVLGLDSKIKNGPQGFSNYYRLRHELLESLSDGQVTLKFDHRPLADGGEIIFDVVDSGTGFDVKKIDFSQGDEYSGRGLPLLLSLCDSLEQLEGGRHVRATYRWFARAGSSSN